MENEEKELSPEEVAAKLDESVACAKNLSGGIGAFMLLALGTIPADGKGFPGCVCAYGTNKKLAALYNRVPDNIKRVAALQKLQAFMKDVADFNAEEKEEKDGK